MNDGPVVAWRVFYPVTKQWTIFQQYPKYFYDNFPDLVEELFVKEKNKVDDLDC